MSEVTQYLPFLIPYIIIEIILGVAAVVHIIKHPHYKFGNMFIWILVAVFIQIIGPVVYFVFGRGDE